MYVVCICMNKDLSREVFYSNNEQEKYDMIEGGWVKKSGQAQNLANSKKSTILI